MFKRLLWITSIPYKLYYYNLRPLYKRVVAFAVSFYNNRKNSAHEKDFIGKLSRYKIAWNPGNKKLILTQIVDDHAMCIKLAAASHFLATDKMANIGLYSIGLYSIFSKPDDISSFGNNIFGRIYAESLYKRIDRIYLAFGGKIVHKHIFDHKDQKSVMRVFRKIKDEVRTKEDVLAVRIEGIEVGDLIYDTCLRFNNKPTLDILDPFFEKILLQAINIFFNCKVLFEKYQVEGLVSTYATYIYHGIIVRMCLARKIPVYSPICGYYTLVHKVLKEYPSHNNNHFLFKSIFNSLENKVTLLTRSKKEFEKRFAGKVDEATFYMKESAFSSYSNTELKKFDWSRTVVVLAHCFFDAPHRYRDLLFPDFYEWMVFTLDELSRNKDMNVLVKPHPNGVKYNDEVFTRLQQKYAYTNIHFIDKKTSQLEIIELRPQTIITANGTAAAEFAYHGFPVITVYDNPFISFDFTYNASMKEEYRKYLQHALELIPKQNNEEILAYFYMQHLHFLQGRDSDYLGIQKYKGVTNSDEFLKMYLPKMESLYFESLDDSIRDGIALADQESPYFSDHYNMKT